MLTVTIKESLEQGWPAGFLIVGGHALTEIALIGLFVLGLNQAAITQWVSIIVGVAGGLVLFYLGFVTFRDALAGKMFLNLAGAQNGQAVSFSALRPFREGILVSIANPTWILWWLSVGAFYVTEALRYGWLGLSFFYSGHILADLSWFGFVSVAVSTGKKFMSQRLYQNVLGFCGVFLIAIALFFIYLGINSIFEVV